MPYSTRTDKQQNDKDWRESHDLVQVNTLVPRSEKDAFDRACKKMGVSRRHVLRGLMGQYSAKARRVGKKR